jgi:hypothetical protein
VGLGDRLQDGKAVVVAIDDRAARPFGLGQAGQASGGVTLPPDADLVVVQTDPLGDRPVGVPWAASSTILARVTSRCGVVWLRTRRCSSTRSCSLTTSGGSRTPAPLLDP